MDKKHFTFSFLVVIAPVIAPWPAAGALETRSFPLRPAARLLLPSFRLKQVTSVTVVRIEQVTHLAF